MRQLYRVSQNLWQNDPFRWLLAIILGGLLGVLAGHTVIASVSGSVSVVDGLSMSPNFPPGSRVYTAPISTPLARGDVVLVNDGNKEYALKRIIGLPGETVQMWRGYVFINGKMLKEPYLAKHTYTLPDPFTQIARFNMQEGQYFVMGDNRECSADSRRYGSVGRDQIKSRVPCAGESTRACFGAYTLPVAGKRTIRAL